MEVKEICTKQDDITNAKEEIHDPRAESSSGTNHLYTQTSPTNATETATQLDSHFSEKKPVIARFFAKKGKGSPAIEAVLHNKFTKILENKATQNESTSTESEPRASTSLRVKKGTSRVLENIVCNFIRKD